MAIRFDPKLGINPRVVQAFCKVCGVEWDPGEVVLLGSANYRIKCPECGWWIVGGLKAGQKCPSCANARQAYDRWERETLDEGMSVKVTRTCPDCQAMLEAGYVLIEVEDGQDEEQPANPVRTGRLHCITEEAAMGLGSVFADSRVAYVPESVAEAIGLHDVQPSYATMEELREAGS